MQTKTNNYGRSKDEIIVFKANIFLILSIALTGLIFGISNLPDVLKAVGFSTAIVLWCWCLFYLFQCLGIAIEKINDRLFIRRLFFVFLAVLIIHAVFSGVFYGFSISMTRLMIYFISLIILLPQIIILSLGVTGLKSPKKWLAISSIVLSAISLAVVSYFSILIAMFLFYGAFILWAGMMGSPVLF